MICDTSQLNICITSKLDTTEVIPKKKAERHCTFLEPFSVFSKMFSLSSFLWSGWPGTMKWSVLPCVMYDGGIQPVSSGSKQRWKTDTHAVFLSSLLNLLSWQANIAQGSFFFRDTKTWVSFRGSEVISCAVRDWEGSLGEWVHCDLSLPWSFGLGFWPGRQVLLERRSPHTGLVGAVQLYG